MVCNVLESCKANGVGNKLGAWQYSDPIVIVYNVYDPPIIREKSLNAHGAHNIYNYCRFHFGLIFFSLLYFAICISTTILLGLYLIIEENYYECSVINFY